MIFCGVVIYKHIRKSIYKNESVRHLSQIHPAEPVSKYLVAYWGTLTSSRATLWENRVQRVQPAVVAGYLWSSALSAPFTGLPLPLYLVHFCSESLPIPFTSVLPHFCPKCIHPGPARLHFFVFSASAVPFLVPPCSSSSLHSILCACSHCKPNICCDCIVHTAHFLHHFLLRYLYCLPSL